MKVFLRFVPAVLSLCVLFSACDGSILGGGTSSGTLDPGTGVVTTDNNILGTWDVVKYEACNIKGDVIKSVTDIADIHSTYWRFVMAGSGDIAMWWGTYTSPAVTTSFSYSGPAMLFYYGDYGCAEVEELTETSFVFLSTDFFPADWYEDTSISTIRVHCVKSDL